MALLVEVINSLTVVTYSNHINKVIIHGKSVAEVERTFSVNEPLDVGYHHIHLKGLCEKIDDRSIHVSGVGHVEILDTKTSTSSVPKEEQAEYITALTTLQSKLDSLTQELMTANQEADRIQNRIDNMKAFIKNSLTKESSSLGVDEAMKLLDVQDTQLKSLHNDLQSAYLKRPLLEKQISDINIAISNLSQYGRYKTGDETITFENKMEKSLFIQVHVLKVVQNLELSLTYMTSPAYWEPAYDIFVSNRGNDDKTASKSLARSYSLNIDYYAKVFQSSGEDWIDTQLALSTTSPTFIKDAPKPIVKGVYFTREFVMTDEGAKYSFESNFKAKRSQNVMAAQFDPVPAAENSGGVEDYAEITQKQASSMSSGDLSTSYVFNIDYKVDIKGKGHTTQPSSHQILINKMTMDAKVFSYGVPSSNKGAFLKAWAQPQSDSNIANSYLPSDAARVFIQEAYTGVTRFDGLSNGAVCRLGLGSDRNIKITSNRILPMNNKLEEDKSTWFVQDKKKFRLTTEELVISVTNVRTKADGKILVVLSENVPKSTDDDIKVELLQPNMDQLEGSLKMLKMIMNEKKDSLLKDDQTIVSSLKKLLESNFENKVDDNEYVTAIVEAEFYLENIRLNDMKSGSNPDQFRVYYCRASNNIYWAKWFEPYESITTTFKYRISWPDDKAHEIFVRSVTGRGK
jgi:uncharacterized protein (TIGR02231 family)